MIHDRVISAMLIGGLQRWNFFAVLFILTLTTLSLGCGPEGPDANLEGGSSGGIESSAPHSRPSEKGGTGAAQTVCYVTPKAGVDAVLVRAAPTIHSSRLGQINAGQRANASCQLTAGAPYTACGGTSSSWVGVTWAGRAGYVALLCVDYNYAAQPPGGTRSSAVPQLPVAPG